MRSRPFLDLMRSFKWFPGLFWTFNLVLAKSHVSSSSFRIFVTFKNRKNGDLEKDQRSRRSHLLQNFEFESLKSRDRKSKTRGE